MSRTLYHIPAWHNKVDCDVDMKPRNNESFREQIMSRAPESFWQRAEIFWDVVDTALERIAFSYHNMCVFSEMVFDASKKTQNMIRSVVRKGSRHYQIVARLLQHGAKLMITEDETLFCAKDNEQNFKKRDQVIAQNVNTQLGANNVGILILGMAHKQWKTHLDSDIVVADVLTNEDTNILKERLKIT